MIDIRSSFSTNPIQPIIDQPYKVSILWVGMGMGMVNCEEMGRREKEVVRMMGMLMMVVQIQSAMAAGIIDCSTVTALVSACSNFITYGAPDPIPGSPCCDAVVALNGIAADSEVNNRRSLCRCLMGLIATYSPNATAIATLPGFCGISLGFTLDPNTDCNLGDGAASNSNE